MDPSKKAEREAEEDKRMKVTERRGETVGEGISSAR